MTADEIRTLQRIDTTVTDLKTYLIGNGQPGIVPKLEAKVSALEKYKSWLQGALAILSSIVALLGGAVAGHLFGKL